MDSSYDNTYIYVCVDKEIDVEASVHVIRCRKPSAITVVKFVLGNPFSGNNPIIWGTCHVLIVL